MISREPIYTALFALVSGAAGFATIGRRLRHWSDVTPAEQPALFQCQTRETATIRRLGAPTVWTLGIELYLYAHSSDPYQPPATVLNPLLDAVMSALAADPTTGLQDLGLPAMVQRAFVAGKIDTDEGTLGDQAIAIIPVEILCV